MKIKKSYIEKAHADGLYVDRTDGTVYPAIPRDEFFRKVETLTPVRMDRLNYCQAQIVYCAYSDEFNTNPILLKSYLTYVAMYLPSTDRLFVFDYYSPTTCQHINKFKNELRRNYLKALQFNCYRRVRGKNGSRIEYEPFIPFT